MIFLAVLYQYQVYNIGLIERDPCIGSRAPEIKKGNLGLQLFGHPNICVYQNLHMNVINDH